MKTTYALFKWVEVKKPVKGHSFIWHFIGDDDDDWKEGEAEGEKPKECLDFVSFCSTPDAVAAQVRKDPLSKYVLLQGEMHPLSVAIPVFIRGKNLATLDHEWGEEK